MVFFRSRLTTGALISLLAGTASLSAQEQEISCGTVPSAVRSAFENAYPKATIHGCASEVEKGKTAYEISSKEGETGRDALFYPDGSLIVVEETIALGNVPDTVKQAVHRRFPRGEITLAEKVTRDGAVQYEFRVRNHGKLVEIAFDPRGDEVK
jgi:hypothetical protein